MFYELSVLTTKLSHLIIKLFKKSAGLTWPGHIVLTFFPNILKDSGFVLDKGYVFISGTNGKTTTAKLIVHILEAQGMKVSSNKSGANLLNGIVTSLLLDKDFFGDPKTEIGVLEVDEFALPTLIKFIQPHILLLLNVSRDQLDRYGETDTIVEKWRDALSTLKSNTTLVLDATQENLAGLTSSFKGNVFYFDNSVAENFTYPLEGDFNVKNTNAALLACNLLHVPVDVCTQALENFDAAYGRGEAINYKGTKFTTFLAKNPASFNNNLHMLLNMPGHNVFLCVLNDNIPDGRDVSWIYDIDPSKIAKVFFEKKVYISGTRAYDLALRLKYAGIYVAPENININLKENISKIVLSKEEKVFLLPNYSAMLESREILTGRKIL